MTVTKSGSTSSSTASSTAAAEAEAARKAAEAKAAAERAKAERERQAQQAREQAQRQAASRETQQASRTRASGTEAATRDRLVGSADALDRNRATTQASSITGPRFVGSPDAIDRNNAPTRANADRQTADRETREARDASRAAERANTQADQAFDAHTTAQRELSEAREAGRPQQEIRDLEQSARTAEDRFTTAERSAQTAQDTAVREAEEALTAQRNANASATAAGQTTQPFPAANDVENVRDLARATPDQQQQILGERASFTEHDVTRVENRAVAEEARQEVGPAQERAQAAHENVATADQRVDEARAALDETQAALREASPDEARTLRMVERDQRDALSFAQGDAFEARKEAHEATQELLDKQHVANQAARDAGDPPPFADAQRAQTAEDVASLSREQQRAILGTESAISRTEAADVAQAVRGDQVHEAATSINNESDPQRAAEMIRDQLQGSNDPAFREQLLRATGDAQRDIGARLTSDDLSREDAQQLTDVLAQSGELAGQGTARILTDGVAAGMDGDGLRGEVKDSLEETVKAGNGALFGVELAQSLQAQGKEDAAKDALEKTKHGIEDVQERYAETSESALAREGELARVKEQWAESGAFNQRELAAGEAAFREEHAETFEDYNDASRVLASTLNGADAALQAYDDPNSNIRSIDNDEGRKTMEASREVMNHAPDLTMTQAGQAALGEAAVREGEGQRTWLQGANEYGRTLEGNEGTAYQDRMASATVQAAVAGMDQLAEDGRAGARAIAIQGASNALGDVDPQSVAGQMKGALGDMSTEVANIEANSAELTPIQVSEQIASSVDGVIGARFSQLAARNGGQLTDEQRIARDRLSIVGTAAGVAGLGQATYNLITDPGVQTAAQVASEGLSLASDAGQARVLQLGREFGFQDSELVNATRPLRALAVGGAAIGIFTGNSTLERVQAGVETGVEAAGLIGSLSAFGAGASGARAVAGTALRAVGKAGLVVGLGFSAIDTYSAIRRGDAVGAAIAGAPIAGAAIGATIGSIVPGAGTLAGAGIGFAVGGLVSLGAGIARSLFGDSPEEKFEQSTDSFLEGALREAGLPEGAAHRLRDVDGDFEGMGRTLPALAEAAGTTPRELLRRVASLPDDQLEDFVKQALDIPHNADDIKDAREQVAEGENVDVPNFRLETDNDQFRETLATVCGMR